MCRMLWSYAHLSLSQTTTTTTKGAFDVVFSHFSRSEKKCGVRQPVRRSPARFFFHVAESSRTPAHGVWRLTAMALCRWRMMARGTSSRTVTRWRRMMRWRYSTSPSTGSNSLAGDPDASAVTTWHAAVQAGGAARLRMACKSFTRHSFLEHFVDVPVLQITDELLNEVDAAVKGSGEGGGGGEEAKVAAVGVQCAPDAAPWHGRGVRRYSAEDGGGTQVLAARRWGGGFSAPEWGLITQVMSPCNLVSVTAVHRRVVVDNTHLSLTRYRNNHKNHNNPMVGCGLFGLCIHLLRSMVLRPLCSLLIAYAGFVLLFVVLFGPVVNSLLMLVLFLACLTGPLGVTHVFVWFGFVFVCFVGIWLSGLLRLAEFIVF